MDYFEQRIGRSANDFLVDLFEALNTVDLYTVVIDGGKPSVKLNVAGAKEVARLVHTLERELTAFDTADTFLAKICARNQEGMLS